MFFGKILRIGSVACATLIAAAGLVSVAAAQPRDPSTSVADDGSDAPEFAPCRDHSRSFPGTGRELRRGEKDDARATSAIPARGRATTERRVRKAKPIRGTSARARAVNGRRPRR